MTIIVLILNFTANLSAQNDFINLDKRTYDYFIKGDNKNLFKTADTILSQGIDYYYLRMRLGIAAYNEQLYSTASKHFIKALAFNSMDTISREYIYYSYNLSGRKSDANLYLGSIPFGHKNNKLRSINNHGLSEVSIGTSFAGYDVTTFGSNQYYYEAVKSSSGIYARLENYFSGRFKGTFAYANYRKSEKVYFESNSSGTDLIFSQDQIYARLTGSVFPGWEFSGFGHAVFYKDFTMANRYNTEYLWGVGISKNGWKIRTGASFSVSNFSKSNQKRGEGYIAYLPSGNLNLYLTSGGMYQSDKNWGETYQISQEIGFKITNFLWMESGIVKGNSFLYASNQGFTMNNSFQVPDVTIYGNIIILPGNHFNIIITPFIVENKDYSWDLVGNTRTNMLTHKSFGCVFKLKYKK